MNDRNTAGKLGFIKDSEGVYRKGSFVFKDGKIIRESNIVPKGTIEDVEDHFTTMGECIRSVLSYSTTLGEPPRSTDVYIDKVGNNYKPSNKFSKNTVAVVTSQRQVLEIKAKDITEQDDENALENKDAEDKPVNPKEIKDFSKPEDIETKTKKELKESPKGKKGKFKLKESEKKTFTITIEEIVDQDFEVEASDGDEALEIAEEKYNNGEFVLEPGEVTSRSMAITGPEDEVTNFLEF